MEYCAALLSWSANPLVARHGIRRYTMCIRAGHASICDKVVGFLTEQGRMKFVRPLYRHEPLAALT